MALRSPCQHTLLLLRQQKRKQEGARLTSPSAHTSSMTTAQICVCNCVQHRSSSGVQQGDTQVSGRLCWPAQQHGMGRTLKQAASAGGGALQAARESQAHCLLSPHLRYPQGKHQQRVGAAQPLPEVADWVALDNACAAEAAAPAEGDVCVQRVSCLSA